jgi:hypothetical protein
MPVIHHPLCDAVKAVVEDEKEDRLGLPDGLLCRDSDGDRAVNDDHHDERRAR